MLGAELLLDANTTVRIETDATYEHGLLALTGNVHAQGKQLPVHHLGYLATGARTVEIRSGSAPARLVVLGGPPFGEQTLMWWNFVGRTHEEIATYRHRWQAEIGLEPAKEGVAPSGYGLPDGDPEGPLGAPVLPLSRLKPRFGPGKE